MRTPIDDRIPFIRILNATEHQGDELWVLASIVRLFNVVRVWVFEVETRMHQLPSGQQVSPAETEYFENSAKHLANLLKQSYIVLQAQSLRPELAYLEEELFKFETLYLTSNLCLIIAEQRVTFAHERYRFLKHSLHAVLHDLNQPISTLISMASLVEQGDQGEINDFVSDINEVMIQCRAQLERGFELIKGSFAVEELSILQLQRLTQETLDALLKLDSITYEIQNSTEPGTVMYSSMWYRGLINNIVDNAKKSFWIKGERQGHGDFAKKIIFNFSMGELSAQQKALVISVADTGIGFNPDILDHGFSEGRSDWVSDDVSGQGIGMSAHVEFIKKLRGEVVLRNTDDHGHISGAELLIKLPLI